MLDTVAAHGEGLLRIVLIGLLLVVLWMGVMTLYILHELERSHESCSCKREADHVA